MSFSTDVANQNTIESGVVDIPNDPRIIAHLEDANNGLVPYDIKATGYDLEKVDFKWVKD
jgi:hypothetical protein